MSYDVKALFTSLSVDPALGIIHGRLQQYPMLHTGTPLSIHKRITLIEFCLKTSFLTFQGKYYEQVQGAAMESPTSPVVANLFMDDFKAKALGTALQPIQNLV